MFRSHLDEVCFLTQRKKQKENCPRAIYFWHLISENEVHCVDTTIDELNARLKLIFEWQRLFFVYLLLYAFP